MKANILRLKEEIKKLVEIQKTTKQNRKTVNFVGVRAMEPWRAAWKVIEQKDILRHMYLAYGRLCGREFSQIESNFGQPGHTPHNQYRLEKIMSQYAEDTVCADPK